MEPAEQIWLIGLSGAGKSTVARAAAEQIGWEAIDTDALIEDRTGRTIPDIFTEDGEAGFRAIEASVIESLRDCRRAVIATGGGAPTDARSRRVMEAGTVVWLSVSPEVAVARLTDQARSGARPEERPLLAGDALERLRALLDERRTTYRRADVTIDIDALDPRAVAGRIADLVIEASGPLSAARFRLDPDVAATVTTPAAHYPIVVRSGALGGLGAWCREVGLGGTAFVIADAGLSGSYLEPARLSLAAADYRVEVIAIEGGEAAKHLGTVSAIYDQLVEHRCERGDFVVNLGGGVVTDMGGFAAATFLRGVAFVHVPTTLLGMVDAAVGGKTGVDHPRGKNLVGAFAQPRLVLIDPAVLATLPERERRGGAAELIKHAFILGDELDPELLTDLEATGAAAAISDELIARSVAIKARVVSEDEREADRRTLLNYGHTTGHAIEAVTGYTAVTHGEGVAIGMHAAGQIAVELGMLTRGELERQQALIRAFGLPERMPGVDPEAVFEATRLDKKVRAGAIRWVLLERLGTATVKSGVPDDLVRSVLAGLARP